MAKPEIRASQLLTTYGPGAMVDLPDDSVIIAGLEGWRYHKGQPLPIVEEPRLVQKLEAQLGPGLTLRKPPAAVEEKGFTPDIAAYRFPQWVISKRTQKTSTGFVYRRLIHRRDLDKGWLREDDGKRYSVIPVRFVRACPRGHVGDINWRAFLHGDDPQCFRELFIEERGTTGDLDTVWVKCACGESRAMSQASRSDLGALGNCDGRRPWLGPGNRQACGIPNRLLVRNASNAYFSQTLSVISIPSSGAEIDDIVTGLWESYFKIVHDDQTLDVMLRVPGVQQQLAGYSRDEVKSAIDRIRGASSEDRPVKEVEFEALAKASDELGTDKPGGDFFARNLARDKWDDPWMAPIERIVLAHRLREVVAQLGFTRFEAIGTNVDGDLEVGVEAAAIALDLSWVPAVENRGEGVFIQFSADAIEDWLRRKAVRDRDKQLQIGHAIWLGEHEKSKREYFGLPYYMLHSFSHLLLTAISMECGYPPSSLKERIYARFTQRQYGVLIYTGSPDAEGTLGGLIEAGRRISSHVKRALDNGRLCSNDPVCAFHAPSEHDQLPLLGSACHGCLLVAETSCEQRNDLLDRSLVISTVERLGCEFFT